MVASENRVQNRVLTEAVGYNTENPTYTLLAQYEQL